MIILIGFKYILRYAFAIVFGDVTKDASQSNEQAD
jgi:hypothetical protein